MPIATSREFAAADSQVTLIETPGAEHVASWNVDPMRYENALRDFPPLASTRLTRRPTKPNFCVTRKMGLHAEIAGREPNFCVTRKMGLHDSSVHEALEAAAYRNGPASPRTRSRAAAPGSRHHPTAQVTRSPTSRRGPETEAGVVLRVAGRTTTGSPVTSAAARRPP